MAAVSNIMMPAAVEPLGTSSFDKQRPKSLGRQYTSGSQFRPTLGSANSKLETPRLLSAAGDKEVIMQQAKMSQEEERTCRELFDAYDFDGGGQIDRKELIELLAEQNWVLEDKLRDRIISKMCTDDSSISYEEFLRIYAVILSRQSSSVRKNKLDANRRIDVVDLRDLEAECRKAFEALDADRSGFLGVDEMKEVLRTSGIPDLDGDNYDGVVLEQMAKADLDNDGQINYEEFVLYRNAVLTYYLEQSLKPDAEPEEIADPWAWQHFAS